MSLSLIHRSPIDHPRSQIAQMGRIPSRTVLPHRMSSQNRKSQKRSSPARSKLQAKKYRVDDPELRRAVRARCEREFRDLFKQPWSELRVFADLGVKDKALGIEKDARAISSELVALLGRLHAWEGRARSLRKNGRSVLTATTFLLRFVDEVPRSRRARLAELDPNGLSTRQWLVRRLTRPRFGRLPLENPRPREHPDTAAADLRLRQLTARDLAIISLLLGNFPQPKDQKMLTVDQVITMERKAMHKAMVDVAARPAARLSHFFDRYNITSFAFLAKTNPTLRSDVKGVVAGANISADVPDGTDKTALVATFVTTGAEVTIDGVVQVSGKTKNDFSRSVMYVVSDGVDTSRTYTVTVT